MTELERQAFADFDEAAAAYNADPTEANRSAFEAATWAAESAVRQAIKTAGSWPVD